MEKLSENVLSAINQLADNLGEKITIAQIKKETGLSVGEIEKILDFLEEEGLVKQDITQPRAPFGNMRLPPQHHGAVLTHKGRHWKSFNWEKFKIYAADKWIDFLALIIAIIALIVSLVALSYSIP